MGNRFGGHDILYFSKYLRKIFFDNYRIGEDIVFINKLFLNAKTYAYTNKIKVKLLMIKDEYETSFKLLLMITIDYTLKCYINSN